MNPLEVQKVHKVFKQGEREVAALAGVDLAVTQGQFLAIMGASGSGKSTLLHLMAGLDTADLGKVLINGQDLAALTDSQLTLFRRRNIGLVFQSFNLIPTLNAAENVALPLLLDKQGSKTIAQKVDAIMESLGIAGRRNHRPDAMSGGEQQRVAIGRALISDPAVILADEPTGNLDSVNSRSVCELLRDLSSIHGKTIVMVTHEPAVAAFAHEVAIMKDGRIVQRFSTQETNGGEGLALRYQESIR